MKFFSARGRAGSAAPSSVNLGPHHISETTRARKSKFYTHLYGAKYTLFGYENFSARGRAGAQRPSSIAVKNWNRELGVYKAVDVYASAVFDLHM